MEGIDTLPNLGLSKKYLPDDDRLSGETFMNCLKRKLTNYIANGKENTFRTAKEWLEITGLCGFKDKTCHHYALMTYLVNDGFVERCNNKLRLSSN